MMLVKITIRNHAVQANIMSMETLEPPSYEEVNDDRRVRLSMCSLS